VKKLRYLVLALAGIGLTACVSPSQFSKPQDLRFQNKTTDRTQILNVTRDHKLCGDETADDQNCPIDFYIDDIKSGRFYIDNAAQYRLKPEEYNLKVKNCTDECTVCETDIRLTDIQDRNIVLSIDANGLPLMLNSKNELICETQSKKKSVNTAPVETTVQVNLAADTLFKFDGSSLNDLLPKGHQEVMDVATKIKTGYASVRQINLTGHTDRLGTESYNQNLAARRAATVRDVLVQHGVDQNMITTQSTGESMPVTDGCPGVQPREALKACLQPDRRVTVEITGIAQ